MTDVHINNLTKVYPNMDHPAVDNFQLEIPTGKLVAFLGPSGCGKTTTLKMIAGLIQPTAGDILFDYDSVLAIPTEKRQAVMVFQNYLLFPYMTIGQNVGFGLKMRGVNKAIIDKKVHEMLDLVKLPDIVNRRPRQLSGGQQQRVALARALITEPRVLLLDEPLSNLDAHLRDEMRDLIVSIQRSLNVTTIFVTHDQEEAVLLADQVALMFGGKLQQYASPETFYRRPISERAARFFGGVNFIPAKRNGGMVETVYGDFRYDPEKAELSPAGAVTLTIRPEQIAINPEATDNIIEGRIRDRIYVGTYTRYKIMIGSGETDVQIEAIRSADVGGLLNIGDHVKLRFPPEQMWVVPKEN